MTLATYASIVFGMCIKKYAARIVTCRPCVHSVHFYSKLFIFKWFRISLFLFCCSFTCTSCFYGAHAGTKYKSCAFESKCRSESEDGSCINRLFMKDLIRDGCLLIKKTFTGCEISLTTLSSYICCKFYSDLFLFYFIYSRSAFYLCGTLLLLCTSTPLYWEGNIVALVTSHYFKLYKRMMYWWFSEIWGSVTDSSSTRTYFLFFTFNSTNLWCIDDFKKFKAWYRLNRSTVCIRFCLT